MTRNLWQPVSLHPASKPRTLPLAFALAFAVAVAFAVVVLFVIPEGNLLHPVIPKTQFPKPTQHPTCW